MKLEEITELANTDLAINELNLTESSVRTPLLVNKYYNILVKEARLLKYHEQEVFTLRREKYDYYLHLAPDEIYIEKPWNRKVLKSDVNSYIDADKDVIAHYNKIETQKYKVKYLEELIRQLNQRAFHIKNIIEHEKFKNGLN